MDSANMDNRPCIGLDLTGARVTLTDLFAEEVRTHPLMQPSGRTEPTSLLAMVSIQTRAMLGREERLDDDSEWHNTQSRIIRSMVPRSCKDLVGGGRAHIWAILAIIAYPWKTKKHIWKSRGWNPTSGRVHSSKTSFRPKQSGIAGKCCRGERRAFASDALPL